MYDSYAILCPLMVAHLSGFGSKSTFEVIWRYAMVMLAFSCKHARCVNRMQPQSADALTFAVDRWTDEFYQAWTGLSCQQWDEPSSAPGCHKVESLKATVR
jgi:hypothetical protein